MGSMGGDCNQVRHGESNFKVRIPLPPLHIAPVCPHVCHLTLADRARVIGRCAKLARKPALGGTSDRGTRGGHGSDSGSASVAAGDGAAAAAGGWQTTAMVGGRQRAANGG